MDKEVAWIRNMATDSQIEGILKQRNDLISKVELLQSKIELAEKTLEEKLQSMICDNCKEYEIPCACSRNKCVVCGAPVGNITFTVCDECWDDRENQTNLF